MNSSGIQGLADCQAKTIGPTPIATLAADVESLVGRFNLECQKGMASEGTAGELCILLARARWHRETNP